MDSGPAASAVFASWPEQLEQSDPLTGLHRAFLELEATHGMFDLCCNGAPLWEYVRFYVHLELQRALGMACVEPFQAGSSAWRRLRRLGNAILGLVSHHPFRTVPKPLFFFGCPRRIRAADGSWWDTAVDPFLEAVDIPYYYIERLNGDRHYSPARTRNVHYFDWFNLVAALRQSISPAPALDHACRVALRAFQFALTDHFGVEIDVLLLATRIWQARFHLSGPIGRLLDKVQPRLAFFASVNYPERIVLEECKKRGIKTIELQHGLIASTDPGYSYPEGIMPRLFPDYLFVWGDYWRETVAAPITNDRIITVGNPYLEERLAAVGRVSACEQVVFLSQPTIGERLFKFAGQLARRGSFPYRIIYRLHPSEQPEAYKRLNVPGVDLSTAADRDLLSLLAESRAQIGVHSAAIFEGLALGLPTFLLPLPGVEGLQPLVDYGWCQIVRSAEEIPDRIPPRQRRDTECLFAKNGKERFRSAVARLLSNECDTSSMQLV